MKLNDRVYCITCSKSCKSCLKLNNVLFFGRVELLVLLYISQNCIFCALLIRYNLEMIGVLCLTQGAFFEGERPYELKYILLEYLNFSFLNNIFYLLVHISISP